MDTSKNASTALSGAIATILSEISSEARAGMKTACARHKKTLKGEAENLKKTMSRIRAEVEEMHATLPTVVNVGTVETPKTKLVHSQFHTIARIIKSAKRKEKNIMLVGEAGGGKTLLAKSIADAIKKEFYPFSVGLQTTKSDLLGFINAHGTYMPSIIRQAYEHGGILLLDEFDCAHAGVVTILNSLLANGHCSFPDGVVNKHPDFICLCACNTYGRGATTDYVGRNRLDAATLDRFIFVPVDYDLALEERLTRNEQWLKIVRKIRINITEQGIKHIVSPRASMDGADLLDEGFGLDEVLDLVVFKGVEDSIKSRMLKGVDLPSSGSSGEATKSRNLESLKNEEAFEFVNIDAEIESYD